MKLLYWTGRAIARTISRTFLRMKIMDEHNIPETGPFILACNHISLSDPPLVGGSIKRELHFMAKKELFGNKLFGEILRRVNAHPLHRGFDRRAIDAAVDILKSGNSLLIFPEGTRARHGDFLPPRPGAGMVAIRSKAPVVPAYINGSNKKAACLRGKEVLGIIFGKLMNSDQISHYSDDKEGYRKLSDNIMTRIRELKRDFSERVGTNR